MEHQFASTILVTILVTSISYVILWIWKKSKVRNSNLNLPPGPSQLPLIGNMHNLVGSLPHHRFRDMAKKYGPVMHLRLGEVTHVLISSAETAKEVMKTHDLIFAQRPALLAVKILSYNCIDIAFAPYGDYWRMLRKLCVLELLSAKRVRSFRSIREEEVWRVVRSISSSAWSPVNFSRMISSLTYCITSRAAFGKIWKGEDVFIPAVKEANKAAGGYSLADVYPSIKLLSVISGMRLTLEKIHARLDKILQDIINEHRSKKEMAAKTGADEEEHDLVDVLLGIQDQGDTEFSLTDNNIKAIILDLFVAGTDTSSTTVVWAMSEMVKHPRVMKKAQEEVRQVFGDKGTVDEAGLHELNYLKLAIKETFRLHPPVPLLLPRESREDCKINGYDIPIKSKVIVNVSAIGRDPTYWNEPERFYPERFLDNSIDYKGTDFELLPFGAGRKMCPGILFGTVNVELPLAQLLFHFDWNLPKGLKPEDLDMSEVFGAVVTRKNDLCLIPIPHHPLPGN
ncbi:hypothetical protein H0E87_014988 [Populus deltoides]|uniref:Cytochrome P450 n=1 Tax=Populus deltoides TaxID=3696 RepID=A0A8T2Y3B6_POPDE|nr:hypothetical protein H0E87_014988 [Populus deltoides]